jgi:hypothetical protein
MSGEGDDHDADEVVAPEVRLRGGTTDDLHVPAERVVQAIKRVPAAPHAERHGHPRLRPSDDPHENRVPDRDVSALTFPASTGT